MIGRNFLSNEEYCTQIRYGMGLFSMRNAKIRLIYHGEVGKIGKLKLGSAGEPPPSSPPQKMVGGAI